MHKRDLLNSDSKTGVQKGDMSISKSNVDQTMKSGMSTSLNGTIFYVISPIFLSCLSIHEFCLIPPDAPSSNQTQGLLPRCIELQAALKVIT